MFATGSSIGWILCHEYADDCIDICTMDARRILEIQSIRVTQPLDIAAHIVSDSAHEVSIWKLSGD